MNLIFFFSSRRRHTRLTCDWSSDVCSSDLRTNRRRLWHHGSRSYEDAERNEIAQSRSRGGVECSDGGDCKRRSEERRVGKECRSRWSADHQKRKQERRGRWRINLWSRVSVL